MTEKKLMEQNFLNYIKIHKIGKQVELPNSIDFNIDFSEEDMQYLINRSEVYEGHNGGLIKGLVPNKEGGIFTLSLTPQGFFRYTGYLKPGSYLSGYKSFQDYNEEFAHLDKGYNEFEKHNYSNFIIPENCKIIDTENKVFSFVVLSGRPQYIFTENSVMKNLDRLVEIEDEYFYEN